MVPSFGLVFLSFSHSTVPTDLRLEELNLNMEALG